MWERNVMVLMVLCGLVIEWFNLFFEFGQYGIVFVIECMVGGDFDLVFVDVIFVDVVEFFVVEFDVDVMFEDGSNVMWVVGIDVEVVGEGGVLCGIVYGCDYWI